MEKKSDNQGRPLVVLIDFPAVSGSLAHFNLKLAHRLDRLGIHVD